MITIRVELDCVDSPHHVCGQVKDVARVMELREVSVIASGEAQVTLSGPLQAVVLVAADVFFADLREALAVITLAGEVA